MNLQEAIQKSISKNKQIKRKSWKKSTVYVSEFFVGHESQGMEFTTSFGAAWHPRPEDILAEDWELIEDAVRNIDTEPVPPPPITLTPQLRVVDASDRKESKHIATLYLAITALLFSIISIGLR